MRKRKPSSKPSKSYMISFGDTMTAMLAFFIVLNTLAKEQTGADLHTGTGSFIAAVNSMGLPGMMTSSSSKHILQKKRYVKKVILPGANLGKTWRLQFLFRGGQNFFKGEIYSRTRNSSGP